MVVGAPISPGPAAGDVEHREFVTGVEFGDDLAVLSRGRTNGAGAGAGGADQGAGVMGREELARERDVGNVAAIGVDALVEDDRGPAEREALSCAGG